MTNTQDELYKVTLNELLNIDDVRNKELYNQVADHYLDGEGFTGIREYCASLTNEQREYMTIGIILLTLLTESSVKPEKQ